MLSTVAVGQPNAIICLPPVGYAHFCVTANAVPFDSGSVGYRGLSPTVNIVPPLRGYVYDATYQRNEAYRMLFLCRHYVAWEGGRVNVRGLRCATPTAKFAPPLRGYDTKPAFQKMSKNRKVGNEETPKSG